jgi:formylglycine-generating enzyme required for sulfatase activity
MGSPSSESGRDSDEGPVHTVELDGFWLGKTEVTQAQYQAIMGTNPSKFKGPSNPVEQVSWEEASEFCRKLSQRAGKTYNLPTEAQWEYACRAGTTTRYSFGDSDNALGDYAWYDSNSGKQTHPVSQKRPNAWGLYDMHGNVWEWCLDWKDSYPSGRVSNPTGPSSASFRVFRGGSWYSSSRYCRSAFRYDGSPGNRIGDLGFRPAAVQ